MANPPPDMRIQTGDSLLCFGKLDQMRKEFGAIGAIPEDPESASA